MDKMKGFWRFAAVIITAILSYVYSYLMRDKPVEVIKEYTDAKGHPVKTHEIYRR